MNCISAVLSTSVFYPARDGRYKTDVDTDASDDGQKEAHKIFHALVASQTLETHGVLYRILQTVKLSLFVLTAMIG